MKNKKYVYAVILNWNGYEDTIACLETLLVSTKVNLRVVVCDNNSSDNSLDKIEAWADGRLSAIKPQSSRLQSLLGDLEKPVRYIRLTRSESERGKMTDYESLVLIQNGANLGFAAGNNVGLRFAMRQADMNFVWLLNNDTLVEPNCLGNMLRRLQAEPTPAVCGSVIHFYDQPQIVQAIGGNRFNRKTGCAAISEGRFTHEDAPKDVSKVESAIDYISGCSMLLPRDFLRTTGLMSEDYFLYYEEIDWFTRAGKRYRICIAEDARLYHREGASIGSKNLRKSASPLSDFHMFRSRLTFMRKYYGRDLGLCYFSSIWEISKRLAKGQFRNAWTVATVLLGKQEFTG